VGTVRLVRRTLRATAYHVVDGTEGARDPQFSPDGQWLAIRDEIGRVRLWAVPGGSAEILSADSPGRGTPLAFSPGGRLLIGAWSTLISIAAKHSPQVIEVRK
jgi:Tol biopolymer transport system component